MRKLTLGMIVCLLVLGTVGSKALAYWEACPAGYCWVEVPPLVKLGGRDYVAYGRALHQHVKLVREQGEEIASLTFFLYLDASYFDPGTFSVVLSKELDRQGYRLNYEDLLYPGSNIYRVEITGQNIPPEVRNLAHISIRARGRSEVPHRGRSVDIVLYDPSGRSPSGQFVPMDAENKTIRLP